MGRYRTKRLCDKMRIKVTNCHSNGTRATRVQTVNFPSANSESNSQTSSLRFELDNSLASNNSWNTQQSDLDSNLPSLPSGSASFGLLEDEAGNLNNNEISEYSKKKKERWQVWNHEKELLVQTMVEELAPAVFACQMPKCSAVTNNIIRCQDCGPHAYFCEECAIDVHTVTAPHILKKWNSQNQRYDIFQPGKLYMPRLRPDGHKCSSMSPLDLSVVDCDGSTKRLSLFICDCESVVRTLVRFGLWASTPRRPQMAFTLNFMRLARAMILECSTPLSSFCHAVRKVQGIFINASNDFSTLEWENMLTFMWVMYNIETFRPFCPDFPDSSVCLACTKDPRTSTCIYAFDGNMRMVHLRKRTPLFVRDPLHKQLFFLDQEKVTETLAKHDSTSTRNSSCSNFQAGSMIRAKNKTQLLDVTGVFGSVCSHNHPQHLIDMTHGERLGYSIHMLANVKNPGVILYDIACLLDQHAKKRSEPLNVSLAVPAFHSFAHKYLCQLKYGPRRVSGVGLTDGEGVERLWSNLVSFAGITKGMDCSNRKDLLEEVMLNYGQKVRTNIWVNLKQRATKAHVILESSSEELKVLEREFEISEEKIQGWIIEEKDYLEEQNARISRNAAQTLEWEQYYAVKLEELHAIGALLETAETSEMREDFLDQNSRLEAEVARIEKEMKIARWKRNSSKFKQALKTGVTLLLRESLLRVYNACIEYKIAKRMMERYGRGVKAVSKIAKALSNSSRRLNSAISDYNSLFKPENMPFPQVLERGLVLADDGSGYWLLLEEEGNGNQFLRRRALDVLHMKHRATEELEACSSAVHSLINNAQLILTMLRSTYDSVKSNNTRLSQGQICIVLWKLRDLHHWLRGARLLKGFEYNFFPSNLTVPTLFHDISCISDTNLHSDDIQSDHGDVSADEEDDMDDLSS